MMTRRPDPRQRERRPAQRTETIRPLWLYQTEPGLGPLLAQELKFIGAVARKAQFAKLHLRNHDLLVLPDAAVQKHDAKPRLATNVYAAPVFGRENVGAKQLDLLVRAIRNERPDGIASEVAGEVFSRNDFMPWLLRELAVRGVRFMPLTHRPVLFAAVDDKFYFGFPRFNHHDAIGRARGAEREGSLPAVVAAAMVFAAKLQTDEVIFDPTMGTGTILVEAAQMARGAALIGSDLDNAAVALAKKNLKAAHPRLLQGDSTRADLGKTQLTLTIANLPFGKQHKSSGGNRAFYESALRHSLLHAAPNWRAVLLTSDAESLQGAVAATEGLSCTAVADIKVRGQAATIWTIIRENQTKLHHGRA
jgi:predicted RNA methylase